MKIKYIITIFLVILLAQGILIINDDYTPHYTPLNATQSFFSENSEFISTKSDSFGNNDLKGAYTLIFFGYTNCPDYCPDTLMKIRSLFKKLEEQNVKKNIRMLFISVDTKDKVDKIKKYVEYFDDDFIGLETDKSNLAKLSKRVGVYYKKIQGDSSIDFYDHTGAIFVTNEDSKLVALYTPPIDINKILEDVLKTF